jgi:mRNA interferase RelE/StbE
VLPTASRRIRALADDPRPRQTIKLRGAPERWRNRFGDYRIIYTISDREQEVYVLRVLRRAEDTYD